MAELVVASDAYTVFPGGVIAIRATDWVGAARGTLSTVFDSRVGRDVVRDEQQCTTAIGLTAASHVTPFSEVDDTLNVDFSAIPELETAMRYMLMARVRLEGDWNPSDVTTFRNATPERIRIEAATFDWYGDSLFFLNASDLAIPSHHSRKGIDHYWYMQWGGTTAVGNIVGTEDLVMRAYSLTGTDLVWFIDQLVLIPQPGGNDFDWTATDFETVPGNNNLFGEPEFSTFVDGADGGTPSNIGKYTWDPNSGTDFRFALCPTEFFGNGGGNGDYQKKDEYDDAEYMISVDTEEGNYFLGDSTNGGEEPSASHCYGLHGVYYIPAATVVEDDFSRTLSAVSTDGSGAYTFDITKGWGRTPEGYGYDNNHSGGGPDSLLTDGSKGIMEFTVYATATTGRWDSQMAQRNSGGSNNNLMAHAYLRDYDYSGRMTVDSLPDAHPDLDPDEYIMRTSGYVEGSRPITSGRTIFFQVLLDSINNEVTFWEQQFQNLSHIPETESSSFVQQLGSTVDVSGWYAPGNYVAFRIKKDGLRIRMKAWDDSGAEPGTWDVDELMDIADANVLTPYDYSTGTNYNNGAVQTIMNLRVTFGAQGASGATRTVSNDPLDNDVVQHWFDDLRVDYDPNGDPESGFVGVEQPAVGDFVSSIEIPYGAEEIVYWGKRDWTEEPSWDPGFGYISFASRSWSDTTAADLQQMLSPWWWFRSVHFNPRWVSMNWRSNQRRPSARRVLVGGGG